KDGTREYVDERAPHRGPRLRGPLISRQPLTKIATRLQPRARQLVELARVQRAHAGVSDRRRLESNKIVVWRSVHPQMLPPIVDIDSDGRVRKEVFFRFMEIARVLEDRAREVSDVHAFDAWVKRGRFRTVADAEADHHPPGGWRQRE